MNDDRGDQVTPRGIAFLVKIVVFMSFCDPTGLFVFGDIRLLPFRVSPLEATAGLTFMLLGAGRKRYKGAVPSQLRAPYVFLVVMLLFNAWRGVNAYGVTSLNSSRFEFGVVMLPIVAAFVSDAKTLRSLLRVVAWAIAVNIAIEVLLDFGIIAIERIRWEGLRANLPLYDTVVLVGSFFVLGVLVKKLLGQRTGILEVLLALFILFIIVLALVRAVWAGFFVAAVVLIFTCGSTKLLKRLLPQLALTGLLTVFLVSNYEDMFGSRGDNYVVESKSGTIFSVSDDGNLLFRIITASTVWEGVTSSISRFTVGDPHGTSYAYADSQGRAADVALHFHYLATIQHAGVLGLMSLLILQWRVLRIGIQTAKQNQGYLAWVAFTLVGALTAMSTNMLFNSNGSERQYIFFFLMGLIIAVSRIAARRNGVELQDGSAPAQ